METAHLHMPGPHKGFQPGQRILVKIKVGGPAHRAAAAAGTARFK